MCSCLLVWLALLACAELGLVRGVNSTDVPPPLAADALLLQCRTHTPVVGLQSTYDENTNTRVLSALCLPPLDGPSSFLPTSTVYRTSHRRDSTVGCVNNTLISGLSVRQYGGPGGRELEVACSVPPAGYFLDYCGWSRWLNRPGENFSVPELPLAWVVRSIISRLVAQQLDWRYKLELCQLMGSSLLYADNNACPVPAVAHGRVHDISHTHSIRESHIPFKVDMLLTCDSEYYWDETQTLAVCENGTWTQLPTCRACSSIAYCAETVCTSSSDSLCLRCLPALPGGLPLVISKSGRRCRAVPVISSGPLMRGFVAGSNLTLDCVARGRPTPTISWHRVLANEDRVPLLDHTHFIHHENGSVTIVNITDMDSGPYVCRAWNAAGSDIVYISVYNRRPAGTGPPSIHHWSPLHAVSLSTEHTFTPSHLHCHTHGYPPPVITWTRLNITSSHTHSLTSSPPTFQPFQSPTVTQYQNGTLAFQPVRTADTALYRCKATNLFGTVTMETVLFVATSSNSGPYIMDWSINYTVSVGVSLEMTCSHTQSTHTTSLWMKKGGQVPITGTRVWQNGNGNLVLETVLTEDQGPYWCVIWDEDSVAMEKTELIVVDHPSSSSGSIPFHNHLMLRPLTVFLVTWVLHNIS